jgi:methyl-accepting chemotaxis protein
LISAFACLSLSGAALSGTGIYEMLELDSKTDTIAENLLPRLANSKEIDASVASLRLAYVQHIISQDNAAALEAEADIKSERGRIEKAVADSQRALGPGDVRQAELLKVIGDTFAGLVKAGDEVVTLSRNGSERQAKLSFNRDLEPLGNKVAEAALALVKLNSDMVVRFADESEAVKQSGLAIFYALSIFTGLVGVFAMVFAVRGIANPILRIDASMRRLAGGDTASNIPFAGRTDEIGSMAGAVEVFRQAAIANKRLEEDAEAARRQAEVDRVTAQQRAEADAAERLRAATSGLAMGLRRLAEGDLAFQLDEAFAPDFEGLRHDFNKSVRQLADTLTTISHSIHGMDDGTREIATGVNDLSKRTEQQAAALEETAAALDEITANVSNSAKRTEEARTIAVQANQSAASSAEVVNHAEEAMRRIEGSSQQISSIIGVIDEIAFQTNLLALNAGVEAARAGEAGKGFAVVAQEVRELAQRSAKAAKEIKELIQNSAGEVENGVTLVRKTGIALSTIGGFISEINKHMDAISVSAREQSTGLAEVNSAVNAMDQTTQQNAAMVEQSTAAASTLALEAEKLRDLVGRFQLDGMASSAVSALRHTASAMAAPAAPRTVRTSSAPRVHGNAAVATQDWQEF